MELVDAQGVHDLYFPWEPLDICPIGDIQYDGRQGTADLPRLKAHLQKGVDRGVRFIGMGDFVDIMSPSNRSRFAAAGLYTTTEQFFDDAVDDLEKELLKVLLPTKGRWLGLLEGHHFFEHKDGTTSDTRYARWLDTPFLGNCALIRLFFKDTQKHVAQITLWVHHGVGGSGVLPTAVINKLYHQKPRYPGARVFMMGHVPQLGGQRLAGLDSGGAPGSPHLTHEDTLLVACGGWSKAYQQGSKVAGRAQGAYPEKGMMPPAILGGAVVHLEPVRQSIQGKRISTVEISVTV